MNASRLRRPQAMNAHGVHAIGPTPFNADGELDLDRLRRLVDLQLEAGIRGLAILGHPGETNKLSGFERRRVIETVVAHARGRMPIWVGVCAPETPGAIEQAQIAESLGADALFVSPLGNSCEAALFDHYNRLAESVRIPVIIHDFS